MGIHVMKTLILICTLATLRQDCTIETAAAVVQGPEASGLVQCGFLGQAYLAHTALASYVEDGHYLKILCTSGQRRNPAPLHSDEEVATAVESDPVQGIEPQR